MAETWPDASVCGVLSVAVPTSVDVGLAHAVDLERLQQEHVFHQREFDADLLAFQVLDGINAGRADDHVAAFAVIDAGRRSCFWRRWRR